MLLGFWQGCGDGRDSKRVVANAIALGVRYATVDSGEMRIVNLPVLEVDGPRPGLVGDVAREEDCRGDYGQEQKSERAPREKG